MKTISAAAAVIVAVATLLSGESEASAKLPSNFKRCSVSDPQMNECLRGAVEDAFHKMKDGVSHLGIAPLDPLKVDQISIDQGQGTSVNLNIIFKNITALGLSLTTMPNVSANIDGAMLYAETRTPLLKLDFMHVTHGRILLLPLQGEGPGSMALKDLMTDHHLKFAPKTKKDGKTYWEMVDYTVKLKPKTVTLDLKGLFGRDGRVGDQLSGFIRQNSRLVFDGISESFQDALGAVCKEISGRLFSKVPVDDIFIMDKKS